METEYLENVPAVWRRIATEASCALALLDADRLEELAQSCQALNCDSRKAPVCDRAAAARETRMAAAAMRTFARVLDATRANLQVLDRLRQIETGEPEYGSSTPCLHAPREIPYGND